MNFRYLIGVSSCLLLVACGGPTDETNGGTNNSTNSPGGTFQ